MSAKFASRNHGRPDAEPDMTSERTRFLRRTRANDADYEVLEKGGLVTAFALTKHEVRYKITPAGRAVLPL